MQRPLILASTSPYRRELLERLRIPFSVEPPEVDEAALPGETPQALAHRLAIAKAEAVAARFPESLVIGSDQVAELDGEPLGKPGDHARAVAQLQRMRGRTLVFHTAIAICCSASQHRAHDLASARVGFRQLSDEAIEKYLQAERPYDCAGSAKSEALGIALLDFIESDDPTTLIGLPLIRTARLLRAAGVDLL